ncbi:MAG: hypothetical protein ABH820_00570 [Patescibacteria group bacterium]|nr:hypothetical protein [Patescibacteria group bacterium]MBU2509051.1 hypothetical protein [Patescibacteria group bacterium]
MLKQITSKPLYIILATLAIIIFLIGTFSLGVKIGERKALHFSKWYDRYERDFGRQKPGLGRVPMMPPGLPGANGVFGEIISTSESALIVQGKDEIEQSVLTTSSTSIRSGRGQSSLNDLKPGLSIAVFGTPNDQGQIEARLIRIFEPGMGR